MSGRHLNRKQGNKTARCAHPGCCVTIREGTWTFPTGFCMDHQPVAEDAAKPVREGVRVAVVHLVPGCSSLAAERLVSLAKEPWL